MTLSRRNLLKWGGAAAVGAGLGPLIKMGRARGAYDWKAKHVVLVSIAGGLRNAEALGMQWGATMPNLLGWRPLIEGYGSSPSGVPIVAPEYIEQGFGELVTPKPLSTPLMDQGALITNLRYAEGAPGHLQGGAVLVSGAYNNIENTIDAHAPAPTLFELHRRSSGMPSTDAWYVSNPGGFYRTLQLSQHPEFGAAYGGAWLSPPAPMSPIVPLITGGERELTISQELVLPTIPNDPAQADAVRKLTKVLDDGFPEYAQDRLRYSQSLEALAAAQEHFAGVYDDPTYNSFYPDEQGIGVDFGNGNLQGTGDSITTYHAERILQKFQPAVMVLTLLDIDACHADFNGYLRGQLIADACVRHLWETIESTPGLAGETALLVVPEHGRQLFMNGNNPDSLGRSGIDHGIGDDGDRDVWCLALGPDFKPGVYNSENIDQPGRVSGRYETIDAVMTAAAILGQDAEMTAHLKDDGHRPGILLEEILV